MGTLCSMLEQRVQQSASTDNTRRKSWAHGRRAWWA
jgi:hypothetical protein